MEYKKKTGVYHRPINSESYEIIGESKDEKYQGKKNTIELTIKR